MAERADVAPRPRATVKTVAAHAGVSTTTVSRVLNGKSDNLLESTRQRVLDAARALDYRPNSVAVGLRMQTTRTIGLMIPDISNAYFHQIARGAEDVAMSHGYTVIFCNTDRRPEKEAMAIELLTDKRVDGIIFTGGGLDEDSHVAERLRSDAHVVTIGPHRLSFPSIGVDDRAAIATGVQHLAEQGSKRIACLGGRPGWLIHEERLTGFKRGLAEAKLPFEPSLVWSTDLTADAGRSAVECALGDELSFDGIVAFSDYAALGAMRALRQAGRAIPGDVAVVGCDDIALTTLIEPELTSIAFPLHEFGAEAARILIAMSERRPVQQHKEFAFELHVRESSVRAH